MNSSKVKVSNSLCDINEDITKVDFRGPRGLKKTHSFSQGLQEQRRHHVSRRNSVLDPVTEQGGNDASSSSLQCDTGLKYLSTPLYARS